MGDYMNYNYKLIKDFKKWAIIEWLDNYFWIGDDP